MVQKMKIFIEKIKIRPFKVGDKVQSIYNNTVYYEIILENNCIIGLPQYENCNRDKNGMVAHLHLPIVISKNLKQLKICKI